MIMKTFSAFFNFNHLKLRSKVMACSYDVFLSFSGEDTRNTFADHLYHGLQLAGLHTFRDNEGINKGEELQSEFKKAIQQSRASVVVLSKNYAASTWCLDELVLILEQRRRLDCNYFVLPVFYGVDPTDVRNQKGNFAIQVKPSSKWTHDNVNKWKTALMQVADLAGHVLSGPETSLLKEIVDTVYNELDRKEVCLPLNITGMASHYKEINSWLEQSNLEFLVIFGMGGSGKTTLAKYMYHSNSKKFESLSFLEDIGRTCEGSNGLRVLQEQLLNDISLGKWRKIPCVSRGTPLIEEALKMNKALIVLDDIVEHKQLVALLGTGKINAQSKIIITTRENTNNWFGVPYWRCQKYEMKLLNDVEASQLLCRHAFGSETPMAGFNEFVLQAVHYCEGNPLALEVLGSSLSQKNTHEYWKSQLNILEKDMHIKIQDVLQTSYESLPYKSVKMLFLHIACFFIGKDMDYVVKILEPDYSATLGIKTLIDRCLLSVSPNKKLTMHRLLQEMGKNIVRQESDLPANRSRVWLSSDSYKILRKRMGSDTVEGLALDMKMLSEEDIAFKSSNLKTDALNNMDRLKLLQLNFVELNGSYEDFSEDLRWLCWLGFSLRIIPPNLYMQNLVAIDMSYSNLKIFEPPMVLMSLRILNLKDSHSLTDIRNISKIPLLETLILWNCYSLVNVCNTLGDLTSLALLNMTGCNALTNPAFPFPSSLHRLFLKDCQLECTDSFPLSFSVQLDLQYLNLANSLFESLPCYHHLEKLRVLDLSFCSRLKCLISLPNTLAELYIYGCELLERVSFQSPRFTLQEFGYLGCICLYEVEGFFKLVPIAKLDETELGHMKWLQEYQYDEVCLVGDDELTVGRSWHIQMLYEFHIMSTSLPDIRDPNLIPKYKSNSSSLTFDVPWCPQHKRLKGINVTFKYAILGDECAWFCKISTANAFGDLMYNPKVFGKPEFGKECIWLSYWPIGYMMQSGDNVNVSIVVLSGLEVHECGVSLVYSDKETLENNMESAEFLGGDMSGFLLSTGAYYLCRRDFFGLMEVGRLTHDWFRILAGDTIDHTEVRGWRKTGRPEYVYPSFTELKTMRCIIHGPQFEDIYSIAEMSKSSTGDNIAALTSSLRLLTDETMELIEMIKESEKPIGLGSHGSSMNDAAAASGTDFSSYGYSVNTGTSRESGSTSFEPSEETMEVTEASEIEISYDDFSFKTGTSQESGSTSKDTDQQRGNESLFMEMIKKSFRGFSRPSQHADEGKVNVMVNGQPIPDRLVKKAEKLAGPIQPGDYWYDPRGGFWGMMGGPCLGIILPFIEEFNYPMPEKCANGNTNVFVNGRELHQKDLDLLARRGLPTEAHRSYVIEISGKVLDENSGLELESLGKLAPTVESRKQGYGMRPPRTSDI